MRKLFFISLLFSLIGFVFSALACVNTATGTKPIKDSLVNADTTLISDLLTSSDSATVIDTCQNGTIADSTYYDTRLTIKDYEEVAAQLGIETATIRAVVDVEAGTAHKGFWAPGKPLINYDITVANKFAPKLGITLSKYRTTHPEIWGASRKKYGSYQACEWARFEALCDVDRTLGIYSAFWGMFQIGGFNWKLCKTSDVNEFFRLMSRSERDQLDLFANFIISSNMLKYLKTKNWAAFAYRYNGPSYEPRGYHTRLAKAYAKYSRKK